MELNYSMTKSAIAQRRRRMLDPTAVDLAKFKWLEDPVNAEKQHMWRAAWLMQNAEHIREYKRLSNAISRARKRNDAELEHKLLVERRLHCMSLPNRKTVANMKPLSI